MATTAAAVVAKARRDVISHFMSRNAVTPESAAPYAPERRMHRRMFEKFQDAGVIKPGKTGHYLDVPRWDEYSRKRRRRMAGVMAGLVAVGAGLAALLA